MTTSEAKPEVAPYTVVVGVSATSKSPAGRISVEADAERAARKALAADVAATLRPGHGAELRLVRGGTSRVLLTPPPKPTC